MKVSAPTGRSANSAAMLSKRLVSVVWSRTPDTAPIATPMTARSTTGASFRRTATGWETATTTSKVARTARSRTISSIGAEPYPAGPWGGKIAPAIPLREEPNGRDREVAARFILRRARRGGHRRVRRQAIRVSACVAGHVFRLIGAEIDEHASGAQRFASHADVTPMQDQPVVGVRQKPVWDDAHESVLDLARRLAGSDAQAVGDPEDMGVDGQRRLPKNRVEHHIRSLAANAG